MPLRKRAKAIEAFQNDPPTTIFLLSVRSGAVSVAWAVQFVESFFQVGINLTAANHVFMLDALLNPSLEKQAIGRVSNLLVCVS